MSDVEEKITQLVDDANRRLAIVASIDHPVYCGWCMNQLGRDGSCGDCEWVWTVYMDMPAARAFHRVLEGDPPQTLAEQFKTGLAAARAAGLVVEP